MVYTPVYTTLTRVEGLLQFQLSTGSVPTLAQTLDIIEEVEERIIDRGLASHTATSDYFDVPIPDGTSAGNDWTFDADNGRIVIGQQGGMIVPLATIKHPIISITSLYKNDEAAGDAPSWTQLVEWNGTLGSTDFMLLKSGRRRTGYALYIYENTPYSGPNRLKMTYSYGYNVPSDILRNWTTLAVGIQCLIERMGSNQPSGLSSMQGGQLGQFIPTQYQERIQLLREELVRIEIQHFPPLQTEADPAVVVM